MIVGSNQVDAFWVVKPCVLRHDTKVSEGLTASIFRMSEIFHYFNNWILIVSERQNDDCSAVMSIKMKDISIKSIVFSFVTYNV
jgi:hypothetical protein